MNEPFPEEGNLGDPGQMYWLYSSIESTTWYTFTPEQDGKAIISTCHDESYDTQLAVYSGDGCDFSSFVLLAANDDNNDCAADTETDENSTSTVELCLEGGNTYYIQVDPFEFFNQPYGQDFGIWVDYQYSLVSSVIAVSENNAVLINWNYESADGQDDDFVVYIVNSDTQEIDSIFGNTEDLPLVIDGLEANVVYEYTIEILGQCSSFGPFNFLALDLSEISLNGKVDLYPIPASNNLFVKINAPIVKGSEISIQNIQGKKLYSKKLVENVNEMNLEIDLNEFSSGLYMFSIYNPNGLSYKEKIVITK